MAYPEQNCLQAYSLVVKSKMTLEIALLFGRMKRTASIRAYTHCILYSLSRQDLNSVLELNPFMAEKMKQVAADRLANDAKTKAPPPAQPAKQEEKK